MSDLLSKDTQLYKDQVEAALFKMMVQAEAKRLLAITDTVVDLPSGVTDADPLPEEPPELIDGILLAQGATGIIGVKETGKSLLALEIQHSLITGKPLWGALKPSHTVNSTVHFLAEHTSRVLLGLYNRTELDKTGKIKVFGPEHLGTHKLLVSNGIRREQAISFYKKLADGAGLVVFDPLAAFIQGQEAENDNAPMRSLIDTMIEISVSTGAACLVLGHQGKPTIFQGRQVKRHSYATRGASATEDAMTAVHYLDRSQGQYIGDGNEMYELRPIHFKGLKSKPFQLVRDKETCRHTLVTKISDLMGHRGR